MATVGEDNERWKQLLYNAIENIYEAYYLDSTYEEFVKGITFDIEITREELEEIGFGNWEEMCDDVVVQEEPAPKFWQDFTQAEKFGKTSIKTRFDLAFEKYKDDFEIMADLTATLELKSKTQKTQNTAFSDLYNELWQKAENYATMNYVGDALNGYLKAMARYGVC